LRSDFGWWPHLSSALWLGRPDGGRRSERGWRTGKPRRTTLRQPSRSKRVMKLRPGARMSPTGAVREETRLGHSLPRASMAPTATTANSILRGSFAGRGGLCAVCVAALLVGFQAGPHTTAAPPQGLRHAHPAVPPEVHYEISARLDLAASQLIGDASVRIRNRGELPLQAIRVDWPDLRSSPVRISFDGGSAADHAPSATGLVVELLHQSRMDSRYTCSSSSAKQSAPSTKVGEVPIGILESGGATRLMPLTMLR
jgi:hypothetical protein